MLSGDDLHPVEKISTRQRFNKVGKLVIKSSRCCAFGNAALNHDFHRHMICRMLHRTIEGTVVENAATCPGGLRTSTLAGYVARNG